jgi:hypothetical protein
MSRKLSLALVACVGLAAAAHASPIASITGTYGGFAPQGGGAFEANAGSIVAGGELAGGAPKALRLDFSSFLSNPGLVGVSSPQNDSIFYLSGPASPSQQARFSFNGALLLSASPGGIVFSGAATLLDASGVDLSPFADGAVFTMTFDPAQFSIQPGPNGGLVAVGAELGADAIHWSLTAEVGGGTEVPEPFALASFGGACLAGLWQVRRRLRPA